MENLRNLLLVGLLLLMSLPLLAQTIERRERIRIDGEIVTALITDTDTLLIADLDDVSISSPRKFKNREEYRKYMKYRKYAGIVYPYAVDAIRIFKETEYVTRNMKKSKRKKHIRRLQKKLKKEFKTPLKKLTKTQGMILTKMIEKELDRSFHSLVKELRGSLSAAYWHRLGKFNGYDLKRKYTPGDDHILDIVLNDMDISYEVDYPEED